LREIEKKKKQLEMDQEIKPEDKNSKFEGDEASCST
jgi:hypothetical protein